MANARPYSHMTNAQLADLADDDPSGVRAELEHRTSKSARALKASLGMESEAPAPKPKPAKAKAKAKGKPGRKAKNPALASLERNVRKAFEAGKPLFREAREDATNWVRAHIRARKAVEAEGVTEAEDVARVYVAALEREGWDYIAR